MSPQKNCPVSEIDVYFDKIGLTCYQKPETDQ